MSYDDKMMRSRHAPGSGFAPPTRTVSVFFRWVDRDGKRQRRTMRVQRRVGVSNDAFLASVVARFQRENTSVTRVEAHMAHKPDGFE